jgi:hypothetical protein
MADTMRKTLEARITELERQLKELQQLLRIDILREQHKWEERRDSDHRGLRQG